MAPAGLCRNNHWKVGDLILLGPEPYRLVGCFESGGDSVPGLSPETVFIPYTADALETGNADALVRVDALLFRAKAGISPEALQRRAAERS